LPITYLTWLFVMPGLSLSTMDWLMTLPCWMVILCTPGKRRVEHPVISNVIANKASTRCSGRDDETGVAVKRDRIDAKRVGVIFLSFVSI